MINQSNMTLNNFSPSTSDVAYDEIIQRQYPVLSQAVLSGASPQLRNMATVGGNLLAVALVALDAMIHTQNANGTRQTPIADFYLLPEDTPDCETVVQALATVAGGER